MVVPVPVPFVRVIVLVAAEPTTFPVTVISPPPLSIEKVPLVVKFPRIFTSPPEVV